ncbi:hypothetical protein BDQ17DRAFT_1431742 [Cyathus striatus]|nr:hypothetical protein BDQ17DRAFT_1431742 [Cyathus striatus]
MSNPYSSTVTNTLTESASSTSNDLDDKLASLKASLKSRTSTMGAAPVLQADKENVPTLQGLVKKKACVTRSKGKAAGSKEADTIGLAVEIEDSIHWSDLAKFHLTDTLISKIEDSMQELVYLVFPQVKISLEKAEKIAVSLKSRINILKQKYCEYYNKLGSTGGLYPPPPFSREFHMKFT